MTRLKISGFLLLVASVFIGASRLVGCQDPVPTPAAVAPSVPTISWSYRILYVSAPNHEVTGPNALGVNDIQLDESSLSALGQEGWELVTAYPEVETAYPNFSDNPKYITGLKSNVRPKRIVLLFKHLNR